MDELEHVILKWNESYATHIEDADRQHQVLVDLIGRLQRAMLDARTRVELPSILEQLVAYTRRHFAWEEQLLEQYRYPGLEQQRAQHKALTAQVVDLQRKFEAHQLTVGAPVMSFLRHWLTDHILESDHLYAPFLKEKGVG
jgi:hemerythrin